MYHSISTNIAKLESIEWMICLVSNNQEANYLLPANPVVLWHNSYIPIMAEINWSYPLAAQVIDFKKPSEMLYKLPKHDSHQGLSWGEFMSRKLIDRDSEDVIGRSLGIGVLGLFHNYFDLPDKTISFPKIIIDSVEELTEKV